MNYIEQNYQVPFGSMPPSAINPSVPILDYEEDGNGRLKPSGCSARYANSNG